MASNTKANEQKLTFTASDIATETGVKSSAIVRRILRAAGVKRPKEGWTWPDKAAAKDALEAVRKAQVPVGK